MLGRSVIARGIRVSFLLGLFSGPLPALTVQQATLQVIYEVAHQYNIDAQDLLQIALTESSFNQRAKRVNKNGTVDWGMFQINSVHWTTTCRHFDIRTLRGNAQCAATIIASLQARHGAKDPNWIGRYHSATPSRKRAYVKRLGGAETLLRMQLKQVTKELERCRAQSVEEPPGSDEAVFAANR